MFDIVHLPSIHQMILSIIVAIALISFWRGLWGLMDLYLYPENEALSYWVSLIAGFTVLAATHFFIKEFLL